MTIKISETTPFSVNKKTGEIVAQSKVWKDAPKEIRFYLVRWAFWARRTNGNNYAFIDEMALRDYLHRKYPRPLIATWYAKLLMGNLSQQNLTRAKAMVHHLREKKKT